MWGVRELLEACARHGIAYAGLWRDRVAELGAASAARLAREAGVRVSSLCRGGFFAAPDAAARGERFEDNLRALDEAAALGADVLVLVCGGMAGATLEGARRMVADGIAQLAPHAAERGVTLGIEPLHPMFAADRSVVVTLGEANDLLDGLGAAALPGALDGRGEGPAGRPAAPPTRPQAHPPLPEASPARPTVGVVVDVYHVWWDAAVYREIARAGARIVGFHVNDWLAPPPHVLNGRGMMGDGTIELRRLRRAVDAAGYRGPIEVEIFNEALWRLSGDEIVELVVRRFREHVLEAEGAGAPG